MSPPNADPFVLEPGAVVGEYRITHKLGEGGMGVVYAGLHPEIGKQVAIKVLAPQAALHPDLIRRFKEEARAVNKIRHPNIIDIFAFNQLPDGRHYFIMEYLDGESLTARLERGSMELGELRRLLGQICSALEAAHQAGVVHRDLKPDNIWVATQEQTESRIKLLDFGIAKLNDLSSTTATQAGVAMGTPQYMPPEQGMGRAIDRRTDIYAFGVVLYQIFAGTLPFDGATAHEIVLKHVTQPPLPPSQHRPIVPRGMEKIILDCLEKDPAHRPTSVKELWARIDAAFAAQASTAAQTGAPAVVPRLTLARAVQPDESRQAREIAAPAPGASSDSRQRPSAVGMDPKGMTSLSGMAADLEPEVPRRSGRTAAAAIGALAAVAGVAFLAFSRHGGPEAPVATPTPTTERPLPAPANRPVAAPAPVAAAASAPATVTIKIDSLPSGAKIVDDSDGSLVGRTPYTVSRPQADSKLALKLEMDGFEPRPVTVSLGASFEQTYRLEKRVVKAAAPRRATPPAPAAHARSTHQKTAPEIEWE